MTFWCEFTSDDIRSYQWILVDVCMHNLLHCRWLHGLLLGDFCFLLNLIVMIFITESFLRVEVYNKCMLMCMRTSWMCARMHTRVHVCREWASMWVCACAYASHRHRLGDRYRFGNSQCLGYFRATLDLAELKATGVAYRINGDYVEFWERKVRLTRWHFWSTNSYYWWFWQYIV